jgi:hypothetical protein
MLDAPYDGDPRRGRNRQRVTVLCRLRQDRIAKSQNPLRRSDSVELESGRRGRRQQATGLRDRIGERRGL